MKILLTLNRKTLTFPLLFFSGVALIALWRWLATGSVFYLFNFPYT